MSKRRELRIVWLKPVYLLSISLWSCPHTSVISNYIILNTSAFISYMRFQCRREYVSSLHFLFCQTQLLWKRGLWKRAPKKYDGWTKEVNELRNVFSCRDLKIWKLPGAAFKKKPTFSFLTKRFAFYAPKSKMLFGRTIANDFFSIWLNTFLSLFLDTNDMSNLNNS